MKQRCAIAVVLLLTVALRAADEERFPKVLDALKAAKEARIQTAQEKVDKLIKQKAGAVPIRKARAELDAIKSGGLLDTGKLTERMKVGSIGTMPGRIRVEQVAGPGDCIGKVSFGFSGLVGKTAVNSWVEKTLWIKADTAGMTDGAGATLEGIWEVTGTKTYTTVLGGSNTVMVLEQLDSKAFEAWRAAKK